MTPSISSSLPVALPAPAAAPPRPLRTQPEDVFFRATDLAPQPPQRRLSATTALVPLLTESKTEELEKLQSLVAFSRPQADQIESLPAFISTTRRAQDRYLKLLEPLLSGAEQTQLKEALERGGAALFGQLGRFRTRFADANPRAAEVVARLSERSGLLQTALDLPKLTADGLTRTKIFTQSPLMLLNNQRRRGWDVDSQTGYPIADVVVVGAGPAGLATAYNLAEKGVRTVVLEGGYAGQAFSDGGAQAVHEMRTNAFTSSMVNTGERWNDLYSEAGLPRHLEDYRRNAREARQQLDQLTGLQTSDEGRDSPVGGDGNFRSPIGRGILYAHLSQLAERLAEDYQDTFLLENAAVTRVAKQDGLFQVETAAGHHVLARKLVMATGTVGSSGQHAKGLELMRQLEAQHPNHMVVLQGDADVVRRSADLQAGDRLWAVSDRLLGSPAVQHRLAQMPAGTRVAVIGSGESASKAVREVLRQNPEAQVDWYTQSPVTPAQVQVPEQNFYYPILQKAPLDLEFGEKSLEQYQRFGTPVTPATLSEVLTLETQGKVSIHEMGDKFDSTTIAASLTSQGLALAVKDPEVQANLQRQQQEWSQLGLLAGGVAPAASLPVCNGMVIMATGYSRDSNRQDPLTRQLTESGSLRLHDQGARRGQPVFDPQNPLVSAGDPDLGLAGGAFLATAADSALPGMAARGRLLADALCRDLPRRSPSPGPQSPVPTTFEPTPNDGQGNLVHHTPLVQGGPAGFPLEFFPLPMALWKSSQNEKNNPFLEMLRQGIADERMRILAIDAAAGRDIQPSPAYQLMLQRWNSLFENVEKPGDFLNRDQLPQGTDRQFLKHETELHQDRLLQTFRRPGEPEQPSEVLLSRLEARAGDTSRSPGQRAFDAAQACAIRNSVDLEWLQRSFSDLYPADSLAQEFSQLKERTPEFSPNFWVSVTLSGLAREHSQTPRPSSP